MHSLVRNFPLLMPVLALVHQRLVFGPLQEQRQLGPSSQLLLSAVAGSLTGASATGMLRPSEALDLNRR